MESQSSKAEAMLSRERLTRRRFLRLSLATGAVGIAPGLVAACSTPGTTDDSPSAAAGAPTPAPVAGGSATGGLGFEFGTFDPISATTAASVVADIHIFQALYEPDPASEEKEVIPSLAVGPPEPLDDTHYNISILDGVVFHDGSPVTPQDVVFSIERTVRPPNGEVSFFAQFLDFIESARVLEEGAIELALKHPVTVTLLTGRLNMVKVMPQQLVERLGAEDFGASPIGSGPYVFQSAVQNDRIALSRFTDYKGPFAGHLEDIEFAIMLEAPSRVTTILSGDSDAIEDVPDRDVQTVEDDDTLGVVTRPGFLLSALSFNCAMEPFSDHRLRQALHYAINKDTITEVAYLGNAAPAYSFLPDHHPDYTRPSTVYEYDPERARALLEETGHGEGLTFTLQVFNVSWNTAAANVIKENWADVGVNVDLLVGGEEIYDAVFDGTFQAQLDTSGQDLFGWDAGILFGWLYGPGLADTLYYWDTDERSRVHTLLEEARRATTQESASQKYAEINEIVSEFVPLYPLHHRFIITAWNQSRLTNFTPLDTGGLDLRSAQALA